MSESPVTPEIEVNSELGNFSAEEFIGQWNKLVSTTNWEKGRIICAWREALLEAGSPVTEYSDEAWAQLVGGVTSQHIGRLRRVYQRFGGEYAEYPGLYWSHFQAALDWDDAPMWLEGAIHNGWSVSQMRGKRWETLGTPPSEQKKEVETDAVEDLFEETPAGEAAAETSDGGDENVAAAPKTTSVKSVAEVDEAEETASDDTEEAAVQAEAKRTRLKVNVSALPDDVADAFESFKLAIIAHRREGWRDTTPESICECLDALKSLALAD